jgi:hypothetical protein
MSRFSGNRGGILKVLLIIFGVLVLCVIIGAVYVAMHFKEWAADAANAVAQGMISESGLPEDQKTVILTEIKQLGDDYKNGKITTEEVAQVLKSVSESPLIALASVQFARQKYIEPSDMTAKEKAEATLAIQRFARGVYEKKIPKEAIDEVARPIGHVDQANNRWDLKENPTRMEIDEFVANAKARADAAMIPNEPYDLNIAEELKKAIHGG